MGQESVRIVSQNDAPEEECEPPMGDTEGPHAHGHPVTPYEGDHAHDGHEHNHIHEYEHGHDHDHDHGKSKPHSHGHGHGHGHSHGHGHGHGSMNMRALVLHVLGDALGNVGVIATGLIIWLSDWRGKYYCDPVISLVITVIIFSSALPLGTPQLASLLSISLSNVALYSQIDFLYPPSSRPAFPISSPPPPRA